ncbi:flagellar type III secretion system protein FliR [Pseudomaricurvus alkylphenolicus]|jgi:flagellar biosynthetic protein FliR|uniref:flagellar biosynthetic protein FliR n=1 Tax=Pseudomaricurvus alkylphenolicus TaxID=1306991 RepID=UPI0014242C25|nr:flagellar biosynthetic protein FliR [Pseudomaricurvus alkylphenolicus]NIB43194.1 flagellar type III secretion system protein FliR [Pseudomaricurvus alkylphenolicus]
MWYLTDSQITEFVGRYLWPLFRISALFMAMPIIGTRVVSARVRIVLALTITLLVVPLLPPMPEVPPLSLGSLLIVLHQILIGLTLGFFLQVVFHLFVLAGQFVAMKMGLGFAQMNDPSSGVAVTVLSNYYLILTTLLFLSMDGHLVVFQMIIESFNTIPIAAQGMTSDIFWQVASGGSWMFSRALLIAMPVLTSLLVVNLSFGVMSRAAPQMNVFTVGFPITLIFGLLLMWFSMPGFLPNYQLFLEEGFNVLYQFLRIP